MWEEVFNMAVTNGIWATLFIGLMIHILRDTAKREAKYEAIEQSNRNIIAKLADKLRVVNEIKTTTAKLGRQISKIEEKLKNSENKENDKGVE